jgi:D-glycero-beta-D-manno-heptose 1-phosphate adenylyltransferase
MSILLRNELIELRATWANVVVGFTSGTFDLLHPGHLEVLSKAKNACDILVVGVNSDSSVKMYKDPTRPIQEEKDRVVMVAALSCVDYAFIFDEKNNRQNITLLKPDLYIKGGEYSGSGPSLSSAELVESYGGKIHLIPMKEGYSTSKIIATIGMLNRVVAPDLPQPQSQPAAFLDRDGTLIKLIDYLSDPAEVELLETVIEGLQLLKEHGFRLIIVTNQPGIGLGYYSKADFYKVTLKLFELTSKAGILFDKIYFSPETKADATHWRKPGRGMFDQAVTDLNIDIKKSFVIGDAEIDMEFAQEADIPGIIVATGKLKDCQQKSKLINGMQYKYAVNFLEAVREMIRK